MYLDITIKSAIIFLRGIEYFRAHRHSFSAWRSIATREFGITTDILSCDKFQRTQEIPKKRKEPLKEDIAEKPTKNIRPEALSTRSPAVGTQVWSNVLSLVTKETPDYEPLSLHVYVDFHQSLPLLVAKEDIHPMTYIGGLANTASKECNDKTLFGIHTPVVNGVSTVGWISMMSWRRLAFWWKSLVLFNGTSSDFVDMDFQDSLRRKKSLSFQYTSASYIFQHTWSTHWCYN